MIEGIKCVKALVGSLCVRLFEQYRVGSNNMFWTQHFKH